jgi:hypothetical protein
MSPETRRGPREPVALGRVVPLDDRLAPSVAVALSYNHLVLFDTASPGTASPPVAVSGLGPRENLVGIDIRPQNGVLYGLTADGAGAVRLYAVDLRTAVATPLTPAPARFDDGAGGPVPVAGTRFGVGFDPTADRLRVVTDAGFNFRLDPNTGGLVDGD